MNKNLEIIRTEIIRILNENGKIRGTELAKRVIEKVGNEKIVYREISALVEAGEIEKKVHDRSHIEYELINLYSIWDLLWIFFSISPASTSALISL